MAEHFYWHGFSTVDDAVKARRERNAGTVHPSQLPELAQNLRPLAGRFRMRLKELDKERDAVLTLLALAEENA